MTAPPEPKLTPIDGHVRVAVRAVPRASRTALDGLTEDGALRVRVQAPPVDGAANDAIVRFLAREVLGVAPSRVSIARGRSGRDKQVEIDAPLDEVRIALRRALHDIGSGRG